MNQAWIWIKQGEFDLESAFALFDAGLWQNACLFSQQASEKFSKAILAHADIPLWNTHDLKRVSVISD
jgi:HEPN domain-containing protein